MKSIKAYASMDKMHNNKNGVEIKPKDIQEITGGYLDIFNQLHFIVVKTNTEFEVNIMGKNLKTNTVVIYDDDNDELLQSEVYVKWLRSGIKEGFGY